MFCLFPHQDVYCVPADDVTPVPEGVPTGRAVLAANMESALTIVWDAKPSAGDRIVVIGAGVLGLLVAWLCRQVPGTAVTVVDVNPERATVCQELGLSFRSDPPLDAAADLVIHASGHPDGLRAALRCAGAEGTLVEASWYGDKTVGLPLGEDFHSRRLTIRSSQVGRIRRTTRHDGRAHDGWGWRSSSCAPKSSMFSSPAKRALRAARGPRTPEPRPASRVVPPIRVPPAVAGQGSRCTA